MWGGCPTLISIQHYSCMDNSIWHHMTTYRMQMGKEMQSVHAGAVQISFWASWCHRSTWRQWCRKDWNFMTREDLLHQEQRKYEQVAQSLFTATRAFQTLLTKSISVPNIFLIPESQARLFIFLLHSSFSTRRIVPRRVTILIKALAISNLVRLVKPTPGQSNRGRICVQTYFKTLRLCKEDLHHFGQLSPCATLFISIRLTRVHKALSPRAVFDVFAVLDSHSGVTQLASYCHPQL